MAEINIQRKRSNFWPWIIGVIIVLIVAWLLIDNAVNVRYDEEEGIVLGDSVNQDYTLTDTSTSQAVVNDFVEFVNNNDTLKEGETAGNDEFIKEGIQKLSNALAAVVDEKFPDEAEINNKADFVQQKADSIITKNNFSENSKEIKEVFISATEVLTSIQQKNNQNIDAEISEVKKSAEKINADKPAINQQGEIQTFFKETGDVLQTLAAGDDNDVDIDINRNEKY